MTEHCSRELILLRPDDDVAVAIAPILRGADLVVAGRSLRAGAAIPAGHKIALRRVAVGKPVRKYGYEIGQASTMIEPGDWVHTHNLTAGILTQECEFSIDVQPVEPARAPRTFMGYERPDGRAGTRNWVAVVATVNCAADAARLIAERLRREALPAYPNVDGVAVIAHGSGCGLAIGSSEHRTLQRCLTGIISHPNVAGAMLVGLGCEVNQACDLIAHTGVVSPQSLIAGQPAPPPVLSIQDLGGISATVEAGVALGIQLLQTANSCVRTPQPLARLTVGTNCGGSDGNSGLTANPALGMAGDLLVSHGAGWVLAETPETYGAEHLLTRRAVRPEVGKDLVALMRWWDRYTIIHGASVDNNPAPGNKAGGITTVYEKSLGAVMKAGSSPLMAVYGYGQQVVERGLTFMDTPGHDPTSVTGLVAGGCNLVAFTTGRGSCMAFNPVPVLKIATNSGLYRRMSGEMDIDAGVILDGVPMARVAHEIAEAIIASASGEPTRAERPGLGDSTFVPWTLGLVL